MKLSKENLKLLKACLPPRSVAVIALRLEQKGLVRTRQYIYRCLDPDHRNYNHMIINEAIYFCIERLRIKREIEAKLNHLKDQQS
jgi:hypothetical protein